MCWAVKSGYVAPSAYISMKQQQMQLSKKDNGDDDDVPKARPLPPPYSKRDAAYALLLLSFSDDIPSRSLSSSTKTSTPEPPAGEVLHLQSDVRRKRTVSDRRWSSTLSDVSEHEHSDQDGYRGNIVPDSPSSSPTPSSRRGRPLYVWTDRDIRKLLTKAVKNGTSGYTNLLQTTRRLRNFSADQIRSKLRKLKARFGTLANALSAYDHSVPSDPDFQPLPPARKRRRH